MNVFKIFNLKLHKIHNHLIKIISLFKISIKLVKKAAYRHIPKSLKLKNVDRLVVKRILNPHSICMKNFIREI